jgi:hypothetical protein
MCGKTKDSFRYIAVRKCIPTRSGAGIYARGKVAEEIGFSRCPLSSRPATKDPKGTEAEWRDPEDVGSTPCRSREFYPCCRVSFHGVEKAFMPAAKLVKTSASAAEVAGWSSHQMDASLHGVEQAFMPAAKLVKKPASAAEVMDSAQARKNGNSAQAQAQSPRIVL